jgi:hypothetical protein
MHAPGHDLLSALVVIAIFVSDHLAVPAAKNNEALGRQNRLGRAGRSAAGSSRWRTS